MKLLISIGALLLLSIAFGLHGCEAGDRYDDGINSEESQYYIVEIPTAKREPDFDGKRKYIQIEKSYIDDPEYFDFIRYHSFLMDYKTGEPVSKAENKNNIGFVFAVAPIPFDPSSTKYMASSMTFTSFEFFLEDSGENYGLVKKQYKTADVPNYPKKYLYLKEQDYHDFFIYCHDATSKYFGECTMGLELSMGNPNPKQRYNIYIDFKSTELANWRDIESAIKNFVSERIMKQEPISCLLYTSPSPRDRG